MEFTALRRAVASALKGERKTSDAKTDRKSFASDKPVIAVFPLTNMSRDDEQAFLADGLAEDIISCLATNRHILVASRAATFAYKGMQYDIAQAANALNARYAVSGSVRKVGARIRVSIEFIDADTSAQIWAHKYDAPLQQLLEMPDAIVEKISGSLGAHMSWAEADRVNRAITTDMNAWEYFQRALGVIERGPSVAAQLSDVFALLEKAIKNDPDYAYAHAFLSWLNYIVIIYGLYEEGELSSRLRAAQHHLEKARERACNDPFCLTWIAASECYSGRYERAGEIIGDVLTRNPCNTYAFYIQSMVFAQQGNFDDAHEAIERARELAPEGGFGLQYCWFKGYIYYVSGEYKQADKYISAHIESHPDYGFSNVLLAIARASYDGGGNVSTPLREALRHSPTLTPEKFRLALDAQPDKNKAAREHDLLKQLWPAVHG